MLQSYQLMSFSPTTMNSTVVNASGVNVNSSFNKSSSFGDGFIVRPTLTYNREFGRHSVGGLFFYEQKKTYSDTMTGYKAGYFAPYPVDLSIGTTWEGTQPRNRSFSETEYRQLRRPFQLCI